MKTFVENTIKIYGDEGDAWLDRLPDRIDHLVERYHLSELTPVSNMTYNYVCTAVQEGRPVILKLGMNVTALAREAACLAAYQGCGAVEVLAQDDGVLLLQQAIPGTTLQSYFPDQEEQSMVVLCDMIQKLQAAVVPPDHSFCHLKDLLQSLDEDIKGIPSYIINKAKTLRDQLLTTTDHSVLLHGDLHHDNILLNDEEWLVIDPKGYIGDPAFELAAFINNPIPELLSVPDVTTLIDYRFKRCSDLLGISEQRIKEWHFVQSVTCCMWAIEDNIDTMYFKELLTRLEC